MELSLACGTELRQEAGEKHGIARLFSLERLLLKALWPGTSPTVLTERASIDEERTPGKRKELSAIIPARS